MQIPASSVYNIITLSRTDCTNAPVFVSAVEDLSVVAGKYKMSKGSETDKAEVEAALGALKVILQNGLERHKPDFEIEVEELEE